MDKEIQEELDNMMKARGLAEYSRLLAEKFGGEAEAYKPYLLAMATELTVAAQCGVLNDIKAAVTLEQGVQEVDQAVDNCLPYLVAAVTAVNPNRVDELLVAGERAQ